jgi:hypothetical protein
MRAAQVPLDAAQRGHAEGAAAQATRPMAPMSRPVIGREIRDGRGDYVG